MKDINHKNNNTPDELTYSVADMSFYTNSFKNEIYIGIKSALKRSVTKILSEMKINISRLNKEREMER